MNNNAERIRCSSVKNILEAATVLFAENAFDSVSVADIAKRARVCKASVFHHFLTKESLYVAITSSVNEEHADYLEQLLQREESSAAKLLDLVEHQITGSPLSLLRSQLFFRALTQSRGGRMQAYSSSVFERYFSGIVKIFEQGRQTGEMMPGMDCAAATILVCGALQAYFSSFVLAKGFAKDTKLCDPKSYASRICSQLLMTCAPTRLSTRR